LEACEQAYLLLSCPFFSYSEKKRLSRARKYYPIDTGLRYAITHTSGRDFGKSLESLIFISLKKTHEHVFYWQEPHQGEVDFITLQDSILTPYQVTWDKPEPRHETALQHFYEAFPHAAEAIFITQENAISFIKL
jgi:hypothetical protein